MKNNFDVAGGKKGPQNARYLPEKIGGAKSFYEIRIRAIAENGVTVENNLLNAEFKGEVTLLNNFEFPQIVARAELVRESFCFATPPSRSTMPIFGRQTRNTLTPNSRWWNRQRG